MAAQQHGRAGKPFIQETSGLISAEGTVRTARRNETAERHEAPCGESGCDGGRQFHTRPFCILNHEQVARQSYVALPRDLANTQGSPMSILTTISNLIGEKIPDSLVVTIRPATRIDPRGIEHAASLVRSPEEAELIAHACVNPPEFPSLLFRAYVAEERRVGRIVGVVLWSETAARLRISELFVIPSWRRVGIGARLLAAAVDLAEERPVEIAVRDTDFAGIRWCLSKARGCQMSGQTLPRAFPGADAYVLQLPRIRIAS